MRLGQTLYFVGFDRPSGPEASVSVRSGKLIGVYAGNVTISDGADYVFPSMIDVFPDPAQADQFAYGMAVRFIVALKYERVWVTPSNGRRLVVLRNGIIETNPADGDTNGKG